MGHARLLLHSAQPLTSVSMHSMSLGAAQHDQTLTNTVDESLTAARNQLMSGAFVYSLWLSPSEVFLVQDVDLSPGLYTLSVS